MMAALAIAAIGACLALPALGQAVERQRLRGQAMALMGCLEYARAEALRLNRPVYLCAANLKVNRELQGCLPQQGGSGQSWPEGRWCMRIRARPTAITTAASACAWRCSTATGWRCARTPGNWR
ncbi:pilus assembly FimT family protein [Chromobacterium vaccinii]|uniref:pilus assembly FimT family protein n=1 Tax=Chromobacterium vaccinii TaxID=1108595 RepID=UPI0036F36789